MLMTLTLVCSRPQPGSEWYPFLKLYFLLLLRTPSSVWRLWRQQENLGLSTIAQALLAPYSTKRWPFRHALVRILFSSTHSQCALWTVVYLSTLPDTHLMPFQVMPQRALGFLSNSLALRSPRPIPLFSNTRIQPLHTTWWLTETKFQQPAWQRLARLTHSFLTEW